MKQVTQKLLGAFLICAFFASLANAQETRFLLKLNEKLVNDFKSYGSLRSNIPERVRGQVKFIEIVFDESKDAEPITMDLGLQINGNSANIVLNDLSLGQIRQQPVRVTVPVQSATFSTVSLMYDAPAAPVAIPELNGGGPATDMYYIRLKNEKTMSGTIDGFDEFAIETRFGKVSMPMDQVAGIKFLVDATGSCVVVLNNGDSITGVPTIPSVELKTDWGQADIDPDFIESLTTTSSARFVQDNSDFGLRWKLQTGTSVAPGPGRFPN